jgi:NTE family protein
LAAADLHPDWVAGTSIGAINGALIAGNAPETRVDKLHPFWEGITAEPWWYWSERTNSLRKGDAAQQWFNQFNAGLALGRSARVFHAAASAAMAASAYVDRHATAADACNSSLKR